MPDSTDDLLRQLREKAFKEELDFQRKLHPEADKDMQERRARNRVFRHPRGGGGGIYDLSQQASGMRLPPKKKLSGGGIVQDFAKGGGVGFERGRGSMYDSYLEALGGRALDPLTAYGRRGSDPRVFLEDTRLQETGGPRFFGKTGQIYTSKPMSSAVDGLIDDHEYRHLALNELRNVMGQRNPAENIYKYGQPMMDAVNSVLNFSGSVNQYNKMPAVEEKFVELFDPPALDEGPYGKGHLSDPADIFNKLAMITEDAGSSLLQSPELRGAIQDVLAGRMSMDDFLSLPLVQEIGKIIDENTGNFNQQFLESINDPRQIMTVMQGLGTFLDRLPAPRSATGETRPEFSDAELLLNYYKSKTGEGYSSQRNPYKSEEEKARVGQMLFNMKKRLGPVIGRYEVNPAQFEEIMFPRNKNKPVSRGIESLKR